MKTLYGRTERPAPVVPDALLDQLAEQFLAGGGRQARGESFEAYVRRALRLQRRPIRGGPSCHAM